MRSEPFQRPAVPGIGLARPSSTQYRQGGLGDIAPVGRFFEEPGATQPQRFLGNPLFLGRPRHHDRRLPAKTPDAGEYAQTVVTGKESRQNHDVGRLRVGVTSGKQERDDLDAGACDLHLHLMLTKHVHKSRVLSFETNNNSGARAVQHDAEPHCKEKTNSPRL